jgi:cytochrome c
LQASATRKRGHANRQGACLDASFGRHLRRPRPGRRSRRLRQVVRRGTDRRLPHRSQPEPSLDQLKAQQASLPAPFNTADLTNGKAKYALCASCHTINPGGSNMTGPNLHGVVGRKAAALDKYNFTAALKGSGITWNAATLDPWLANPRAMVPGTKMSFVGMRDAKDRTDVIAYLMVNSQPAAQ